MLGSWGDCSLGMSRLEEGVGQRVVVCTTSPVCAVALLRQLLDVRCLQNISTTAGFNPSGGGFGLRQSSGSYCPERGYSIPTEVSFEQASFVEPTNCCLKAVKAQIAPVNQFW